MALLSLGKIREIQTVAELYATQERARLVRADAAVAARVGTRGISGQDRSRPNG